MLEQNQLGRCSFFFLFTFQRAKSTSLTILRVTNSSEPREACLHQRQEIHEYLLQIEQAECLGKASRTSSERALTQLRKLKHVGLTPSFDPVNAKSLSVQAYVQHEVNLKCKHNLISVHRFCNFRGNQDSRQKYNCNIFLAITWFWHCRCQCWPME